MNPLGLVAIVGSLFVTSTLGLVAQIAQDGAAAGDTSLWISSAATGATATALVYVVRQIAAGNLVHRNPHTAETQLAELVKRVSDLVDEGHERERDYRDLLMNRDGRAGGGGHGG